MFLPSEMRDENFSRRGLLTLTVTAAALLSAGCHTPLQRRLPDGPYERLDRALTRCRAAWEALPNHGAEDIEARTAYNLHAAAVFKALSDNSEVRTWTGTQPLGGWRVTFAGDAQGLTSVPPAWCDKVTLAPEKRAASGVQRYIYNDGMGIPVVMEQKPDTRGREPFMPRNWRCIPATFTAEFTGERQVTVTFHHTRNVQTAKLHGRPRALAADLTAPILKGMDRRFLMRYAFRGLVRPDDHLGDSGIYTPEIFDPKKIPLVLTHGIESDPHIWRNVMNEIAADPELRQRYQVWYFLYPTGLPVHLAAARMRIALQRARDFYDPQHRSKAMEQMILCGHSMGGVLTRMQIIDSSDDLYRAFFTVPPAQLPLSPANQALVQQTLFFEHLPFVKRAVFVTTPHQGSDIPEIPIVRAATLLIRPTRIVRGLLREMGDIARHAVNPALFHFQDLGGRSTATLSPKHPLLPAIHSRPIRVPFHNILAVWSPLGIEKPLEQTTDGAVTYQSAYLPGAETTDVIRAWHSCIEQPALAEKLLPILRRHAGIR
jgi:hypothetical protein